MQRTWARAAVAATAIFLSAATMAADGVTVSPVVVTATRTAQTADDTLSSVSVVTRDDIERMQPESLPALLGRLPGVEYTQQGPRGTLSNIHMRGTNNDHVVVLVDGVRWGSATSGTSAFQDLPLDSIERIEVVRGPRSSLYGSDAIGGVIQIFTRKGSGAHVSVTSGSHGLAAGSAGYGAGSDRGHFSVNVSGESSQGFDARQNDCAGCPNQPDKDGFRNRSMNVHADRQLTRDLKVSGQVLASNAFSEYDGAFQNSTTSAQRVGSVRLDWQAAPALDTSLRLGRSVDRSQNYLNGTRTSNGRFETTRNQLSWQNDITIGTAQLVTAGIDADHTKVASDLAYNQTERDTTGVFVEHQWTGDAWSTQVNARRQNYDRFGDQTTGSVALGYRFNPALRAYASWGSAFKAPSFNQLYYPGYGNPDLESEQSRSLEAGLRGRAGVLHWKVAAYRTDIDNLIQPVEVQTVPYPVYAPRNIGKARITGLELSMKGHWQRWQMSTSVGFKNPEDRNTGNQLPRRAKQTLDASVTRALGRWALGADVSARGKRYDDGANTTKLDPYAVLDLRATRHIARAWRVDFKIANATDTHYQLVNTYNTDGRNYQVSLTWQPGADGR